jgi:hypothetical protein
MSEMSENRNVMAVPCDAVLRYCLAKIESEGKRLELLIRIARELDGIHSESETWETIPVGDTRILNHFAPHTLADVLADIVSNRFPFVLAKQLRQQTEVMRTHASLAMKTLINDLSQRPVTSFRRHEVCSAALQNALQLDQELSFLFLHIDPENPALRLAVQPGRIGKFGNFPKHTLGNLANSQERELSLLPGFSCIHQ